MSTHVLLNLLNELGKEIKCEAGQAFNHFLQRVYVLRGHLLGKG